MVGGSHVAVAGRQGRLRRSAALRVASRRLRILFALEREPAEVFQHVADVDMRSGCDLRLPQAQSRKPAALRRSARGPSAGGRDCKLGVDSFRVAGPRTCWNSPSARRYSGSAPSRSPLLVQRRRQVVQMANVLRMIACRARDGRLQASRTAVGACESRAFLRDAREVVEREGDQFVVLPSRAMRMCRHS